MPDNPIEIRPKELSDKELFRQRALDYHEKPRPGKLEIRATKPLGNATDLALAYSPGVAEACLEIKADPSTAARYTARANLVAVVSNGSAALGLGDIGALASKPIMEGKAVLFKKFANIDVFDVEIDESDPEKLAAIVKSLEPSFGAVNLEDIKAPECFTVEARCRETMKIPVFHDDQHGTAIVVGAAATNALHLVDKRFEDVKIVSTGGGAAGIACLDLLLKLGVKRENVWLVDIAGVVYDGRAEEMTQQKAAYAQATDLRRLDEVIEGADLFLGLSAKGVLTAEMVKRMGEKPIVFALANPDPEISWDEAKAARPDVVMATGRSDFPNQVNNVLCFPFIFRGALDVGATEINDAMKLACVKALAHLARAPVAAEAQRAYRDETLIFGREYLIPKPFDPRLLSTVSSAVARAAMDSGVATRPIDNFQSYTSELDRYVYRSGLLMRPIFDRARRARRRVVFAEGEDDRVLQAATALLEDGFETPALIGRPRVIEVRAKRLGLPITAEGPVEIVNPEDDPRYPDYWRTYLQAAERDGVSPDRARAVIRTNPTAIGAVMVSRGEADTLICGAVGRFADHLRHIELVLGRDRRMGGVDHRRAIGALSAIVLDSGPVFIADTHVNPDPSAEQLVDIACAGAGELRRFGIEPRIAFVSHSNFGDARSPSSEKMREAVRLMDAAPRGFEYEGEMNADAALDSEICERIFPNSRLRRPANLLIMPNIDAANATKSALKVLANGLQVGPVLLGLDGQAHVVTASITARGVINAAALAAAGAGRRA